MASLRARSNGVSGTVAMQGGEKEVLLQEQQQWPYLMFVLQGTVVLEHWQIEIGEGGTIGAAEYFDQGASLSNRLIVR